MTSGLTRRDALQGLGIAAGMPAMATRAFAARTGGRTAAATFAYVGCRTTKERNARGEGIGIYQVENGVWHPVDIYHPIVNPSFLITDPVLNCLYAVHGDMSEVSAFRIEPATGKLTLLNEQSTKGRNPAHLALCPDRRSLILANYATGTLVRLPVRPDGSLEPVADLLNLPGQPGPHKIEQVASHPHQVVPSPDGRFLLAPDKGLDRVFILPIGEGDAISADRLRSVHLREGSGCRHIAFNPRNSAAAYVVNELDSTVTTCRWNGSEGQLEPQQILPCVPDDFIGENRAAEICIHPNGQFLYVSNRGHDSVGAFAIDSGSARLRPLGWVSAVGKGPRFITLTPSGEQLLVANELSDSIYRFEIDPTGGRLLRPERLAATGSPVCIAFFQR